MAKLLGNDYRLFIESAVAGTYNEIKGQQGIKVARQAGLIDISSKDDGAYATQAPTMKSVTLDCEVFPNLPDANGYTRLETRALASPQVATLFQVKKGATVVFQASMYIGSFDTDMGKNDVVKTTFQLALEAAPTVDLLS